MPRKPLAEMAPHEAREELRKAQAKEAPENQLFYDGDHYQDGRGYIGPMPGPNEPGAARVITELRKGFTSRNAVAEVTQRHANGVAGREFVWGLTPIRALEQDEGPNAEEQALIDRGEAALTPWWDARGIHAKLLDAVCTCLHQRRAVVRIYVPEGRLTRVNVTRDTPEGPQQFSELRAMAPSVEAALDMIYVDTPHPSKAAVLQDELTVEDVGVHALRVDDQDYVDIYFVRRGASFQPGVTVARRTGDSVSVDYEYQLGGRLLLGQLERPLFITPQVQQQQRALNLAQTMIPRNLVTAGFLERIIRGAQMPGKEVEDPTVPGGKRWVPGEYETGPGTTTWLKPIAYTDTEGKLHLSNPDVSFREPVSPEHAIAGAAAHYTSILHETDQLHHLITGDATASAVSRVEARLDFLHSLRRTQAPLQRLGRWLLETVLALAEAIAEVPGEYTGILRGDFNCRLQVGQLTSDEQTALVQLVEAGLVSREDAMALLGTDDVDAAIARINSQPGAMLDLLKRQFETLLAGINAHLAAEAVIPLLGLNHEQQRALLNSVVEPEPEDPARGEPDRRPALVE